MEKSQGAELQTAARRSNRNEATFFQYLFLRDPLNSALLGQCWGQRDNHDSWALLSQSSQSGGRQTCHKRVTTQSRQGWDGGPELAAGAQIGC